MYHDVSEIFTGDMRLRSSIFIRPLRELYGQVERLAQEKKCSAHCRQNFKKAYEPYLLGELDEVETKLLKAADTMAAFMKCAIEKKAGNEEFNEAYDSILKKLQRHGVTGSGAVFNAIFGTY
mgnify:CR=1 FL=1